MSIYDVRKDADPCGWQQSIKMDKKKLESILFSERTRSYAILDGASVPELRMKLYEMKPPQFCLFTGELEPDMAEVAPYLVRLYPKTEFTEWVLNEFWGKNWGIFAQSRKPLQKLRNHFRSLITVYDEEGNPMYFRYYDPRVLNTFLPTCQPEEINTFFGDVEALFAESEDKEKLVQFANNEGNLRQSELDIK